MGVSQELQQKTRWLGLHIQYLESISSVKTRRESESRLRVHFRVLRIDHLQKIINSDFLMITKPKLGLFETQEPRPWSTCHSDHGLGSHREQTCPLAMQKMAHSSLPDHIRGHFRSGTCPYLQSQRCGFPCLFSPLVPNQVVLGDKAAKLNPAPCRRPWGRFHVTHLGPAEMDGDPEINKEKSAFQLTAWNRRKTLSFINGIIFA